MREKSDFIREERQISGIKVEREMYSIHFPVVTQGLPSLTSRTVVLINAAYIYVSGAF